MRRQPPLIPQLHGQADDVLAFGAQHGRDRRRINSTGHGNRNGAWIGHFRSISDYWLTVSLL
jgi:hypothetical protein